MFRELKQCLNIYSNGYFYKKIIFMILSIDNLKNIFWWLNPTYFNLHAKYFSLQPNLIQAWNEKEINHVSMQLWKVITCSIFYMEKSSYQCSLVFKYKKHLNSGHHKIVVWIIVRISEKSKKNYFSNENKFTFEYEWVYISITAWGIKCI